MCMSAHGAIGRQQPHRTMAVVQKGRRIVVEGCPALLSLSFAKHCGTTQSSPDMSTPVPGILERIAAAGKAYEADRIGSRESLIELGRDLVAALEIPSEFLQRSFWAEVRD